MKNTKTIKREGLSCIECDGEHHWLVTYMTGFTGKIISKCDCKKQKIGQKAGK